MMGVARIRKVLKHWFRKRGFEVRKLSLGELDDVTRLVRLVQARGIHTFLDVGANRGQFATDLRVAGYGKRIISFEPLSEAHGVLSQRAAKDAAWIVAERMALGRVRENRGINIAGNGYSSSLLPMSDRHVESAPCSAYVGKEAILVDRLDAVLPRMGVDPEAPLALKIDTQGYEGEVLAGAGEILPNVKILFTELSLVPLYTGAPTFDDIYVYMRDLGYRCVALSHEFSDPKTGEMLQVNGTFVRDS